MPSERLTFTGAAGAALDARLDLPEGAPRAFALFAHCFTCSKDSLAAARIARGLAGVGVATLRFDFTGLGGSEGDFANTGFSSNIDDLVAAADHLRRHYRAPALLVGHSLGGTAVLAAAQRIPEARCIATIAAPAEPAHVRHLLAPAVPAITAQGAAEVEIGGRHFTIAQSFLDDIAAHDVTAELATLEKALLVFHAPGDDTVGIDNATRIFVAARHPKSFVSLDDADHLLTRREDGAYVASVLAAWAVRYVGEPEPELAPAPARLDPGTVLVEEAGGAKLVQRVRAGPHLLAADEPREHGGTDAGPSPYDLLLAALGTCTTMTLRLYAERKGWPLERAGVALRHNKVHATDCAECETREGRIDRIERDVTLDGPLSAEQRARMLEIADKCPVHRTLKSEIDIRTRLAEGTVG